MHRFFVTPEQLSRDSFTLESSESHHCLDVLRLGEGDRITVFDGNGTEAMARITSGTKNAVAVSVLQRSKTSRPGCAITLVQAIPKGKNMDLIVQKAVELGASRIIPVISERTVVHLTAGEAEKKQAKWTEIVIEACKQCGQNYLPAVAAPVPIKAFLERAEPGETRLIASLQPDAKPIKTTLAEIQEAKGRKPDSISILIGPEGDFTPAETGLAKSVGCHPVTLGPIILRTETAAIYCLSVLAHELF